ncbi:PGF-pre-PGF domain-containing protein [Methanolobus sp. ZRKC3]|uniref:PGF-pre-PGF domain-containing protein n=1 Tax=Methanolobus sp. ZRKC3 TaxID=3125786 RepID=UPI003250A486
MLICSAYVQTSLAQATVTVVPSNPIIQTDQNFSIDIIIEPEENFVGLQMNIQFDNSLASANEVSEGELLSNSSLLYIFNPGTIDNSQGFISDIFAVTLGAGGITNDDNFIHVNMNAGSEAGYCNIGLEDVILSNSKGVAIPIDVTGTTIEITDEQATQIESTQTPSGGGGGGGGGVSTEESADNIELVETKKVYVLCNNQTSYLFEEEVNPITSINYLSLKNSGSITGIIEILKGTSAMVAEKPSGLVYRNINIWIGKSGYANSNNIESPVVNFKVSRQWMDENSISADSIVLKRYSSAKWYDLPTEKTGEDGKHIFFESKTPGFSSFSIVSSIPCENIPTETEFDFKELEQHVDEQGCSFEDNEIDSIEIDGGENATLEQNTALLLCLSLFLLASRKRY